MSPTGALPTLPSSSSPLDYIATVFIAQSASQRNSAHILKIISTNIMAINTVFTTPFLYTASGVVLFESNWTHLMRRNLEPADTAVRR